MSVPIGELEGVLKLKDTLSEGLDAAMEHLMEFAGDAGPVLEGIGVGVAGGIAVIGGLTAAIIELGEHGAAVADVQSSFDRLSGSVSNADAILAAMRQGTVGAIDDFALMKDANLVMQGGLKLTTDQWLMVTEATRAAAKAHHEELAPALDEVSQALATGRARGLQSLGIIADQKGALLDYSTASGVASSQLTTLGDVEAKRIAILQALKSSMQGVNVEQADFSEVIEQMKAGFGNFIDSLSVAVAESPALLTVLNAIAGGMTDAFGADQVSTIKTIVSWIDSFAEGLVTAAKDGVLPLASAIVQGFADARIILNGLAEAWDLVKLGIEYVDEATATLLSHLPGVGAAYADVAKQIGAQIDATWQHLSQLNDANQSIGASTQSAVDKIHGMEDSLGNLHDQMVKNAAQGVSNADVLNKLGAAHEGARTSVSNYEKALDSTLTTLNEYNAEVVAAISKGMDFDNIWKIWGSEIERTTAQAQAFGLEIPKEVQALVEYESSIKVMAESAKTMTDTQTALSKSVAYGSSVIDALEVQTGGATIATDALAASVQLSTMNMGLLSSQAVRTTEDTKELTKQTSMLGQTFTDVMGAIPGLIQQAFTGGGGFAGAMKAVGSLAGSDMMSGLMGSFDEDTGKVSGGLFSGLAGKLGSFVSSMAPVIGSMLGPAISAITSAIESIFGPHTKADVTRMAKDMGVTISDTLAQTIADNAKNMFGGNEQAAVINSLKDIIQQAGGLTAANYQQFAGKLHDVFTMVGEDQMTVAQGATVLNDNFQSFTTAATDSLGLLSSKLVDIVKLDQQFGTNSTAIASYVQSQLQTGIKGLDTFLSNATMSTKESADAVSDGIVAAFGKMMDSGMSFTDAIKAIGPELTKFGSALQQNVGFQGSDAFTKLNDLAQLATDKIAGPALDAVQGLTSFMVSLSNSGVLTQSTFSGLASQITDTFNSLVKQGKDGGDVMVAMQGPLQTLWEQEQQFGLKVDDSTQSLLDEAQKAGIVGEAHKSSTQQMIDGIDAVDKDLKEMVGLMTGTLTTSIEGVGSTATDVFGQINKQISAIPSNVPITFRGSYSGPSGFDLSSSGTEADVKVRMAAQGIYANRATPAIFGEGGEPELGGPVSFMAKALAGAFDRMGGGSQQPVRVEVVMQMDSQVVGRQMIEVIPDLLRGFGINPA